MVTVPPTPLFTTVVVVFAVVFGILWTAVNFYHLYPYVQYFLVARLFGADSDPYTRLPEGHEFVSPPTFDVLLPAYEEGNVIHQAISSIRSADYPQHRIRINVLVEPEDADTRDALTTLAEEYRFDEVPIPSEYEEVVVPEKYPGMPNKPRALNFGFDSTDGDIVGVIDAEDIVDPDLFSTVAYALVDQGNDYVQGKLDMVNEYDGWKNLVFRAEYAFWFRLLVPSFHFVGYPVPLGGTTNFFRRETLERASDLRLEQYGTPWSDRQQAWLSRNGFPGSVPWDPRNVTEDFELGILLWKEGFDMTLIDVVTSEESPLTANAWIRQRTRWQKGKLYTFLQYLEHPPASLRGRFHGLFQSFLPHLAPINIVGIVVLTMVATSLGYGVPLAVQVVLVLGVVFLVEMFVLHATGYWLVTERRGITRFVRSILIATTVAFYWLLLWGAELRAMKQLYSNQLHWEKTAHHGRNESEPGD